MKRILTIIAAAFTAMAMHAQVAEWLIKPVYDKVERPVGSNIIVTDSLNVKTIWTTTGIRLESTTDQMFPYSEGYIVTTEEDSPYITAIYDKNGSSTTVDSYQLGWGYPFFHNDRLLVFDGKYFAYMNGEGDVDDQRFVTAYPFHGGYASCYTYENIRKMKDPYFALIDKNLKPVTFVLDGKRVDRGDVEFISSVNDEGLAVVVIKHKLYYYDAEVNELRPVFATPEETNTKYQAKLDNDMARCYVSNEDSATLKAKCGKTPIVITFNSMLLPIALTHDGARHEYTLKPQPQHNLTAKMKKMMGENNKIALYWGDKEMLPPQFEKVPLVFEDKAIVQVGRKFGMLLMHPDENFVIKMNEGKPIGFRHKSFDTFIRVDMPPYVSAAATVIELSPETGCRIDKISRETKETRYGNYTQYKCELDIPKDISDTPTDLTYPAYVVYEGLQSTPQTATAQAWHNKYYNVDINDNDYSISGGELSLTFNVSAVREVGETIYPHEARIMAEGLNAEILERVSETRYKCKVYPLREGLNTIIVQILEEGCPPADYTFEVTYTKPVASSGKKQKVTIVKRQAPPRPNGHLKI